MVLATTGTEEPKRTTKPTDPPASAGNDEVTTASSEIDEEAADALGEIFDLNDSFETTTPNAS